MLRIDGRAHDELRPIRATAGYLKYAEGSVLIEVGDTRVLCAASVEDRVPPWMKGQGHGWVTGEYQLLPRSTEVRTVRESTRGGPTGRTQEIQRLIGRSLRSVVDLGALGERTIWMDCDVLQADGGTRTAAVTGAWLALAHCADRLLRDGKIKRFPLRDLVAATSVGVVQGDLLLDLSYAEDSQAAVDMNIVKTGAGAYVEIQATAEETPFDRTVAQGLLDLADRGIERVLAFQRETLGPLADRMTPA